VPARLPQAKGVANDLARRGVFAVCYSLANGTRHRCWQSYAQSFDFRHFATSNETISRLGSASKVLNVNHDPNRGPK
jgi:hypothetical protein